MITKLKNEFSWSFSRDRLFRECRRAYYYNYYASWGGWERDADEFAKKAYRLKNIKNLDIWAGDVVHRIIKWVLENKISKQAVSSKQALDRAEFMLNNEWKQSEQKAWLDNPKNSLNLFEHYYHRPISQELIDRRLKKKVYASIKNFYNSGFLEYLSGLGRQNYLCIEKMDSFFYEKVKLFANPDFVLKDQRYKLYDWKTGKPSAEDILQLSCYCLYAMNKWEAGLSELEVIPVYLSEEKPEFKPLGDVRIEEVKVYIRNSIEQMQGLLKDINSNEPDIDKYTKTGESSKCQNCFFQEICS